MSVRIEPFSDTGIYLIGREGQGFDDLLSAKPAPADLRDDLNDFSVFLANDSDKTIVGYSVRWEIGDEGIPQTISFIDDFWLVEPSIKLGKGAIAPGGRRLVSILRGVDAFWAQPDTPEATKAKAHDAAVKSAHRLRDRLKGERDWRVRIDGVILADGQFIGENKGGFFEITKAKIGADRDFYRDLIADLNSGSKLDALLPKRLATAQAAHKDALAKNALTADRFYKSRQGALAQALVDLRAHHSEEELMKAIRIENSRPRAVIRE